MFEQNIVLDMVAPTVSIIVAWMCTFAFLSITEGKDKKKIKRMLSQYVSPSILATLIDKSPKDILKAEVGTKENLTILFSDIRGFTSISERLAAEQVVELLNGYLSGMVDVIFEHEGTLDKFIGDAIMAFWGAPIKIDDHGLKAVLAALDMRRQLVIFNQGLVANGGFPIDIGIGIHTGTVILGNIGSEKKLDYTVIGDNVNLASRMEGLTKTYGSPILITESTYDEVKLTIPCRIVDMVRVVGKEQGVKIYEPLDMQHDTHNNKIVSISATGFDHYLKQNWEKAISCYIEILSLREDDMVSKLFIARCEEYKTAKLPSNWDGIYTMLKK
jgi:adenylate cyclase